MSSRSGLYSCHTPPADSDVAILWTFGNLWFMLKLFFSRWGSWFGREMKTGITQRVRIEMLGPVRACARTCGRLRIPHYLFLMKKHAFCPSSLLSCWPSAKCICKISLPARSNVLALGLRLRWEPVQPDHWLEFGMLTWSIWLSKQHWVVLV